MPIRKIGECTGIPAEDCNFASLDGINGQSIATSGRTVYGQVGTRIALGMGGGVGYPSPKGKRRHVQGILAAVGLARDRTDRSGIGWLCRLGIFHGIPDG